VFPRKDTCYHWPVTAARNVVEIVIAGVSEAIQAPDQDNFWIADVLAVAAAAALPRGALRAILA
jgi:hypothetical protein